MLRLRDPLRHEALPISVAAGDMVHVGFVLPTVVAPLTRARVLVVGDLVRRVLEDLHSAQVLATLITEDRSAADDDWRAEYMVRPMAGVYADLHAAEEGMGRPVDLVIVTDEYSRQLTPMRSVMGVAPVHYAELLSEADPASVRFALARVPYAQPVDITRSVLDQADTVLARWRKHLAVWGRHPSRPIPPGWRTAAVDALDDNVDVGAVVTMLLALEEVDDIAPGVKFEAFAYLDRVLAVDLARELGRSRR